MLISNIFAYEGLLCLRRPMHSHPTLTPKSFCHKFRGPTFFVDWERSIWESESPVSQNCLQSILNASSRFGRFCDTSQLQLTNHRTLIVVWDYCTMPDEGRNVTIETQTTDWSSACGAVRVIAGSQLAPCTRAYRFRERTGTQIFVVKRGCTD